MGGFGGETDDARSGGQRSLPSPRATDHRQSIDQLGKRNRLALLQQSPRVPLLLERRPGRLRRGRGRGRARLGLSRFQERGGLARLGVAGSLARRVCVGGRRRQALVQRLQQPLLLVLLLLMERRVLLRGGARRSLGEEAAKHFEGGWIDSLGGELSLLRGRGSSPAFVRSFTGRHRVLW